jgi:DNA-binding response OmpR family regulator
MDLGRILVVDDEAPVREVLTEYFSTEGYAVEAATSGVEALIAVRGGRADLVLLDVRMPGLDGVQVLQRIRELTKSVPVIMVTANEDVGLAKETLKLGAFDYVAKPFDFTYLERAVTAGLSRVGARAAGEAKPGAAPTDPCRHLARAVFGVTRAMSSGARASTGARLEDAALAAARDAAAGRPERAVTHLAEIALLLTIAADLSDLPGSDRSLIEAALEAARHALPVAD